MALKKRGTMNYKESKISEEQVLAETKLTKYELQKFKEIYKKYEGKNNYIQIEDFYDLLKEYDGFSVNDRQRKKILKEATKRNIQDRIDYLNAAIIFSILRDLNTEESDDENINWEYVDAFAAMGGGPGIEGTIKKETLVNIIKNEFGLLFDVEELLDDMFSGSDELENSVNEDSKSAISRHSFFSAFLDRRRKSNATFKVHYKDFLKFCEQMDAKE